MQNLETVLHAASREGGCTLVSPGDGAALEFLDHWLEQADPYALSLTKY